MSENSDQRKLSFDKPSFLTTSSFEFSDYRCPMRDSTFLGFDWFLTDILLKLLENLLFIL